MTLSRRSKNVRGFVNFPVDDPAYKCTGEGGMFVKLVVVDDMESGDGWGWGVCCGVGGNYFMMNESFLGDDVHEEAPINYDIPENATREEVDAIVAGWNHRTFGNAGNFHFPHLYEDRPDEFLTRYYGESAEYLSTSYLAIVELGSTGWSGARVDETGMWHCRFDDLTEDGKALYKQIEKLYEGQGKLYLQTWLDT